MGFYLVDDLRPRLVEYPMTAGGAPDTRQAHQLVIVNDLTALLAQVVSHKLHRWTTSITALNMFCDIIELEKGNRDNN